MKNSINIFSETGCIPHEVLWKYRKGMLSASEKHAVEMHLTDCELCSDALAGMMNMETDEMMAGLRKSVRNISAPKKVIRFYDYRILSAAAAVAALAIIFTYVINSPDKEDKKEIAQLLNPEPKNEQKSLDIGMPTRETTSALKMEGTVSIKENTTGNESKMGNISSKMSTSAPIATLENSAAVADADKQEEAAVAKDNSQGENVATGKAESGFSTPAQTARTSGNQDEPLAYSATKNDSKKKNSPQQESSKVAYYNDLKVSRTPAMTESEKPNSQNKGTAATHENANEKAAEPMQREYPFVYSKTLRDGMYYFQNKQYTEASQIFSIILERLPGDVNSQYYKGVSEMEMRNYAPSSVLLNKAMLNSDKTFYEESKFKLALCYVALNKKEDAEKLLREIASEKGTYSHQATEELQRLKFGESGK